jgi:predicted HAD superfamily phosphohydrolase
VIIKEEKRKPILSKKDLKKLDIDEIFKKVDRFKAKSPMKLEKVVKKETD